MSDSMSSLMSDGTPDRMSQFVSGFLPRLGLHEKINSSNLQGRKAWEIPMDLFGAGVVSIGQKSRCFKQHADL